LNGQLELVQSRDASLDVGIERQGDALVSRLKSRERSVNGCVRHQ
jgi:hypothetical protein